MNICIQFHTGKHIHITILNISFSLISLWFKSPQCHATDGYVRVAYAFYAEYAGLDPDDDVDQLNGQEHQMRRHRTKQQFVIATFQAKNTFVICPPIAFVTSTRLLLKILCNTIFSFPFHSMISFILLLLHFTCFISCLFIYFHLKRTIVIPNRNTIVFERTFQNSEQLWDSNAYILRRTRNKFSFAPPYFRLRLFQQNKEAFLIFSLSKDYP